MPRPVRLAGQRLRRRPDKRDAGRRPSGRRIPRPAASGRTRALCRSSSSHRNRFAGFRREPCWGGDKTSGLHFSAFLHGGGITTLGVCFMPSKRWARKGHGGLISSLSCTCSPSALRAHTAAHRGKHGAFSPPETSAGSIGSTAWVPCASSLSARRSSMSRLPLLRRTTAEMPILLSAATLCRIR